jgi:hypothetical protein
MTKKEILELARQAKFFVKDDEAYSPSNQEDHELTEHLERFAKLVAEHERERCIYIAENYWKNCLSRAPQGTFLTSKKETDRNYSNGIIQGAQGLVTVLKSPDQQDIYSTKTF